VVLRLLGETPSFLSPAITGISGRIAGVRADCTKMFQRNISWMQTQL